PPAWCEVSMAGSVEDRARLAALKDWENEEVRHLVVGLLRTDRPLLDLNPAGPFYLATLGCEASDENGRFCAAYNDAVSHLVHDRGVRGWAPRPRRLWCRDRERGLLLLGGDWSAKVGRVDVLDGWHGLWMASYDFLRKHMPHLPWDGTAESEAVASP